MYRLTALIFAMGFWFEGLPQAKQDFRYYNDQSLSLYEEQDWKALISLGNEAIDNGHDFYYLQMRMGIANYELQRYMLAISHFRKALQFNADESLALEYLYYSFLFSGRESDALVLYNQHKMQLSQVKARTRQLFKGLYSEGGVKISNNEVDEVGSIGFFHIGLLHQLTPGLQIYQGYSRLSQNFSEFTEVDNGTGGGGPGPGPGISRNVEIKRTFSQNEYYIKANIRLAQGWQLFPAYHYQAFSDSLNNAALSLGLAKHLGVLRLYGAAAFTTINDQDQHQWTAGATIYPLANLNLYIETNYTLLDTEMDQNNIFYHKIGGKVAANSWLEASYTWGEMFNYTEMDAFYMINIPDVLQNRIGVTFIQIIKNKHRLLFGYLSESKKVFSTGNKYKHHAIFAGLNIHF